MMFCRQTKIPAVTHTYLHDPYFWWTPNRLSFNQAPTTLTESGLAHTHNHTHTSRHPENPVNTSTNNLLSFTLSLCSLTQTLWLFRRKRRAPRTVVAYLCVCLCLSVCVSLVFNQNLPYIYRHSYIHVCK